MNLCCKALPEGWVLHDTIDLKQNKKQFWLVQGICFLLAAAFVVAGCFIVDPVVVFGEESGSLEYIVACVVVIVGLIAYIVLHELTHGVFLYAFNKLKPKFGFVGWAAYCGNEGYCDKPHYVIVALAPLVLWGIVFGALNLFFHAGIWFWVIWVLQTMNVSGASGDIFVSIKMARYPKEILVQDTGTAMKVYRKMTADELAAENREQTEKGEEHD